MDTPKKLYEQPANTFVAGFIGSPAMNLFEVARSSDGFKFAGQDIKFSSDSKEWKSGANKAIAGIRPEDLKLSKDGINGQVKVVEDLGAESYVHCIVNHNGSELDLVVRQTGSAVARRGEQVRIAFDDSWHLFSPEGQRV